MGTYIFFPLELSDSWFSCCFSLSDNSSANVSLSRRCFCFTLNCQVFYFSSSFYFVKFDWTDDCQLMHCSGINFLPKVMYIEKQRRNPSPRKSSLRCYAMTSQAFSWCLIHIQILGTWLSNIIMYVWSIAIAQII